MMVLGFILSVLGSVGIVIVIGATIHSFVGTKFVKNSEESPKVEEAKVVRKSQAYLAGYRDMAKGHGVDVYYYRSDGYCNFIGTSESPSHPYKTRVMVRKDGRPCLEDDYILMAMAKDVIEGKLTLDPEKGQTSREYLAGEQKEFEDYYSGGLEFLDDIDEAKFEVLQEIEKKKNEDRLIEARKKGLKEINSKIVVNMGVLDKARAEVFSKGIDSEDWQKAFEGKDEVCSG